MQCLCIAIKAFHKIVLYKFKKKGGGGEFMQLQFYFISDIVVNPLLERQQPSLWKFSLVREVELRLFQCRDSDLAQPLCIKLHKAYREKKNTNGTINIIELQSNFAEFMFSEQHLKSS